MDLGVAVGFVIALAVLAANLPFVNERLFAVVPLRHDGARLAVKPFWLRLVELVALYLVVGLIARALEGRVGTVYAQGWEFYAVTVCLFVVAAYPGYVLRYLRRGGRHAHD